MGSYRVISVLVLIAVLLTTYLYKERHSFWLRPLLFDLGAKVGWDKRAQEMKTMADILAVSTAIQAFGSDHGVFPEPPIPSQTLVPYDDSHFNSWFFPRMPPPWPLHPKRKLELLRKFLQPKYIKGLPTQDYWGNPLYFDISNDRRHFVIVSLGADGIPDTNIRLVWDPVEVDTDIIYYDFTFISAPDEVTH
jgi:hypothetical protein